jgi:signal transduction histidine kinase
LSGARRAGESPDGGAPTAIVIVSVAAVYIVAARIGLMLSVAYSNATPVWAPVGISMAALLLFGRRVWPAITIGAFVANAMTPIPLWVAGVIAVGNTLEAVVGAELLHRADFRLSLDRVRDVLSLVGYGAIVATALSATVGSSVLALSGEIPWHRFPFTWQLWWHGDAMGVLIVAPLLLTWGAAIRRREQSPNLIEEAILMTALVGCATLVFFGGSWRYPYILFPFLIWAALRFKQRGATTVVFVMAVLAIWGILAGTVPIGGITETASVQVFQTLMALLAITSLLLTASVAENEQSKAELNESASLLQAALDSTTDGILVLDLEGRISSVNARFFELWGIPDKAASPGDDALALAPFLGRLKHPDQVFASESRMFFEPESQSVDTIELSDGRVFERYSQAQRIDGVPVGRVWSFRDVTKQKELEDARSRFIDDAAHELRNPAAVLVGMADVLNESAEFDPQEVKWAIDGVSRQAIKMSRLLDRMLDLGRLERAPMIDTLAPLDLAVFVSDVVGATIVPDGRTVTMNIDAGTTALGERGSLEQILENLLTNAFRYGGRHIEISARVDDDKVRLIVSDDGGGVPADLVPHVFDPFRRGRSDDEGYGLGLSIVKRLCERMNAEVAYTPAEPHGAKFEIALQRR